MTRTLLIVDDIKSNREILKNMLRSEYAILEAEHGSEALAIMTEHTQTISAVLLDLGMPVMDGYEVLAYMKEHESLAQLPVIVTTGQTDSGSEERALSLGAKDYISKPYKSAIIRQRIKNTINLRETAAAVNALARDALTGLMSRSAFLSRVSEMTGAAAPGFYTLACFDVDKFKVINDQYGTAKGDSVLRHIAGVFSSGFEPLGGICSRFSADNFAVLYPSAYGDSKELVQMRERAACAPGLASPLSFSIGRYVVNDTWLAPSAMFDRASLAAEKIKGRYDTKIMVYEEAMREQLLAEQEIVTEMEGALHAGQFEVWYQPQYNHSTGALIGAEALVRWNHPRRGIISPGLFVPIFEENGFIYSLDKYVWESVCRYLREELDEGRQPLAVSVNISRYDVFRSDFFEYLTGLVSRYELPAELLRLEITESAFAESTRHIVAVVKRLIDYGFTLEIDDFGSGYSSLNTLKSVPAQVVKLDMRFLEDQDDSQRGGNILESVVRMTKWLGMSVIAEGVERRAQADYLRSIGCNYIQGYLYAKPMPEQSYRELCLSSGKEEKLLALETVENLDNDSFWSPESMDTLIFNSYVGAACIYEYYQGRIELLRATEKYAAVIGGGNMSVGDVLKLDWENHLDSKTKEKLVRDLEHSVETHTEIVGEYDFRDLPNCPGVTTLRSTMRVIASAGSRYLVYCTNDNITAQRAAEARERVVTEQLRAVLDNVACGITATVAKDSQAVEFILANDKYYSLLGYTKSQYAAEIGVQPYVTIYPEDVARVVSTVAEVNRYLAPRTIEYRALKRDGSVRWLRSNLSIAVFEGVTGLVQLSTYIDITEQKAAEQELTATSEQLRTMMDDIPGGFCRIKLYPDGSMKPVYVNDGLCRLTGMTHDEFLSIYENDALAGVHHDDLPVLREAIAQMLTNGKATSSRYRLLANGGGYVWLSIFGRVTKSTEGESFLNIYYSDANEQVAAEELQREIFDNLPYGVALYEYDGSALSVVHLNSRYWELVGRSEVAYSGTEFLNAVCPDDREAISHELALALAGKRDFSCDIRVLDGSGGYRPFHVAAHIIERKVGIYSIYAAYTPISNEAMSVQEMLPIVLGAMMDARNDYSFVKDRNLRYVCSSREVARLVGLASPDLMIGKTDHELFNTELADAFSRDDNFILESGESLLDNIDRIPSEDGSPRYACTSKFPLKDSYGNIVGVYGVGRDVTEARTMRSQLELLTDTIPGGIASCEYENGLYKINWFNDGFLYLFGLTREEYSELSRRDVFVGVFEADREALRRQLDDFVSGGTAPDIIYRVYLHDGSYKWINLLASVAEHDGEKILFNIVLFDITERQEAVEALRVSEEENRLAMQHTGSVVCRYDVASRTLSIPESAQKNFELTSKLVNLPFSSIIRGTISAETINTYTEFYDAIHRGVKSGSVVFQRLSVNGWRWLETHFSTIFSERNEPVSAVISFTDITDQLERDNAYKRWQQSYLSRDSRSYSMFRCNLRKRTTFDARSGELLQVDFDAGEFNFDERTALYAAQYVLEDDRDRFIAFLNVDSLLSGYYNGKRMLSLEYRESGDGGEFRWLRLNVDLVEHAQTAEIEAYMLFEDIDEAKRQELATLELAESDPLTGVLNRNTFAAQVNNIIATSRPNARHALLMLDIDGFKQVNDAFGHSVGDAALIDIAEALSASVSHNDLVGRLGGDEFLIFLNDIAGDVVASTKAKAICALARRSFSVEVEISGSVGIAVAPRDGDNYETLYKKVDSALYHVKGIGRDGYIFYHDDMADQHLSLNDDDEADGESAKPKKKRRMLIVDDSRIDHAMLTNIFASDFIIEKAKDGNSALIRLRHYGTAISVVLLDLMMPGMDGFAVLQKMQESPELRGVPVIVVSGEQSRETSLRAIRAGAVDVVTKPVDPEILRVRVSSAISKAENERLRAKNSLLEYQNSEITRYKTALEHSGIVVIEHDWVAGTFIYDPVISRYIAGNYDKRSFWYILLSDFVAETSTVQRLQNLVHEIATDRSRNNEKMLLVLKTPKGEKHWFRTNVYKTINEIGLTGKLYMTFVDLGEQRPTSN